MNHNMLNTLILKRFCGDEYYPIESARWSIWEKTTFCVEIGFKEGTNLQEDTEYLAQKPLWELYFNIPPTDEAEVKPGMLLEEKDNCEDETHFYYCEHFPTLNPRLEVLDRDGDRLLFRITGECCDVNF